VWPDGSASNEAGVIASVDVGGGAMYTTVHRLPGATAHLAPA
jgi:hypothetical protein